MRCNYPKSFPEILSFLVTNKCVCRCKHCFNWYEISHNGAIGNKMKQDLTIDEIEGIFKNFEPMKYIYIGGGEPFIRNDLFEIMEIIYKNCEPLTINISTNGQLLENTIRTTEKMLCRYPNLKLLIKVSIDAIGKEHDEIRQREGAFENAICTYQSLMYLKRIFQNLEVGINTVFSNLNQDKIFDIYNYLANLSPKPDCMAQLLVRANPREAQSKQFLDIEKYRRWTDLYVQDMLQGKFEEDILTKVATIIMYDYIYNTVKQNKPQIHCYAGIAGMVIDNEGMVGPCEHREPYGSLRDNDYDIKKIWYSDIAEKRCEETYNHCFCTNEPQWWHPSVAYNREVTDKGRAFIEKFISENQSLSCERAGN